VSGAVALACACAVFNRLSSGFWVFEHRQHRLIERVDDGAIAHSEWTRVSGRGIPP
jgi:hypothetical protein